MEKIKTKKKLNKKPLIICLVLALVFGIVGFVDIKSNAAESSGYSATVKVGRNNYNTSGSFTYFDGGTYELTSDSPMYGFYYRLYDTPTNIPYGVNSFWFVISKNNIYGYESNSTKVFVNGEEWYYIGSSFNSSGYNVLILESDELKIGRVNVYYDNVNNLINDYVNGDLDYTKEIDYDNLPIDDDMLIPENLKRNVITNEDLELGDFRGAIQRYDYITWKNTSEVYHLQLQVMPVVQYFQMKLNENKFTKEFYGEWITQEIFDEVTNSYTICTYSTDLSQPVENNAYVDGLNLKSECDDKYSKGFLEENYLNFAYRIRYVDVENEKAGCWLTLVPSNEFDSYDVYVEYADSSMSDKTDGNGLHNEYTNLEDIENAKTDITTENDFKDKYGVTTGDIDTSQATNWLYSVVDFIKTTPQMVGVVLAFLPQPILYGMYITIFLGCIASAIAIVKALI